MGELISKELLSLVLNYSDINNIYELGDNEVSITRYANIARGSREEDINIDTLGRLCKEWCLKQGYHLIEYVNAVEIIQRTGCRNLHKIINTKDFKASTVIKATKWVANKKGLL